MSAIVRIQQGQKFAGAQQNEKTSGTKGGENPGLIQGHSGEFVSVFHRKGDADSSGGNGKGSGGKSFAGKSPIPNDPFMKELGLTGGYDKSTGSSFYRELEGGDINRKAYMTACDRKDKTPIRLLNEDYATPEERQSINHMQTLVRLNAGRNFDLNHNLNNPFKVSQIGQAIRV